MRNNLLNLFVLVSINKNLLLCKILDFLLNFSKNLPLYQSDLLNLYVLVSISKNIRFIRLWAGIFLLNFSKNIIFYTKFSKNFKMTI
jgi:hypothetical protein